MMSLCPLPQLVLSSTSTATLVVSFSPHLSPLPFLPWMLVTTTVVVGELEKVLLPLHWDILSTYTLHCKCLHDIMISSQLLPVSSNFYLFVGCRCHIFSPDLTTSHYNFSRLVRFLLSGPIDGIIGWTMLGKRRRGPLDTSMICFCLVNLDSSPWSFEFLYYLKFFRSGVIFSDAALNFPPWCPIFDNSHDSDPCLTATSFFFCPF